jgi:hypothetical protein
VAKPTYDYFASLITLVESRLDQVKLKRIEYNPQRALFEIQGSLANFDIRIKEIYSNKGRMFSYYIIEDRRVLVGFDNYPDRRALTQKHGEAFSEHMDELIPHKHGVDKLTLELTDEMSVEKFLAYVNDELMGN